MSETNEQQPRQNINEWQQLGWDENSKEIAGYVKNDPVYWSWHMITDLCQWIIINSLATKQYLESPIKPSQRALLPIFNHYVSPYILPCSLQSSDMGLLFESRYTTVTGSLLSLRNGTAYQCCPMHDSFCDSKKSLKTQLAFKHLNI